ncbi:MAG: ABC transporter substrate-binding protein [Spirochaetia bacterium]|nr:ABC transporter substrate-binding protein [Spirochaetia bacterium]
MKKIMVTSLLLIAVVFALPAGGQQEADESMIIRVAEQVPNLLTIGSWDGQAFSLNGSIYDYLVEVDAHTGELVPSMATGWNSPDGIVWTFTLRKGITFHDGSDFTAEDVVFTIKRTQDKQLGHLKAEDFKIVDRIIAVDDYTVEITLNTPNPTFVYLLTDYNMAMLSSEYDYASKGETNPMGSGPFKLERLIPKESAVLTAFDNYWNEGYPIADELHIYFVPDIDASVSLLESGEVDIVTQINPTLKNRLEAQDGFTVVAPYQESRIVAMRTDQEPFDDNRVRLALKYTMDPEVLALASQGIIGESVFYNENPLVNTLAQHKEIPHRGRDIAKAKELLAQAGYPNGLTVDLYYPSDHPYSSELAQTIKELAAPAGFDLKLNGSPRDIYLSQYWLNGTIQLTGWGVRVDPTMLLRLAYYSGAPWNESHLSNPEVDRLIDAISSEVDNQKRMEFYAELQDVFFEEGPIINIQVPYLVGLNAALSDYRQPITMLPQLEYASIEQ